ncbi:MAG: ABC transporter ATP-binding protein [Thermodesulfobacteriota bacterium]
MSAPEIIIDARGLTKSFGGRVVVNQVSMQVAKGEIYGFLGPNGSGKTTFLRMLCGLLRPDSGSGACLGLDIVGQSDRIKPRVGYMAQRFSLYEDLSVAENLHFIARIYRVPGRRAAVEEVVERMGLGRYRRHLAGALSGGWRQRLALACCLVHRPQLLLLDEPTAGVDPKARRDFWEEVHRLTGEGLTALISTHYMDEAERCHRLAYIAYGNLLAAGTPDELIAARGLTSFEVRDGDGARLADELAAAPGVEQVVPFGNVLRVSGRDAAAMRAGLAPLRRRGLDVQEVPASLEEVFISLMSGAEVN